MPDNPDTPDHRRQPGPRPLSRRATRLLVIAALVLVMALSIASVYYLLGIAEDTAQSPPPTAPADTVQVDTTARR